jgi:phosphoribosylaminoimidazolecarboxamide formyltransferase/IMP cyclohydrolase
VSATADHSITKASTAPATGEHRRPVRRALISVFDKSGLGELVTALHEAKVQIVSTGTTATVIAAAGVPVIPVEEVTGAAEFLDGRVKTLHPAIHGGLLADTYNEDHLAQLAERGIDTFDLVVTNLYPFASTVAAGAAPAECIEHIDIGGPAMVRAAAKNHASVAVVTSPSAYPEVVAALSCGGFTLAQRQRLATEAFVHTATYDVQVAGYLGATVAETEGGRVFPAWYGATWTQAAVLRYGENPHQRAALYVGGAPGVAGAEQLHGKDMSYNNYVDTDAAVRAAFDQPDPAVAIIKHANPCGIAVGPDIATAYARAHACDPVSAFGGVIAANRTLTAAMARGVAEVFTEVVAAPDFDPEALALLTSKKNVRVLRLPEGMTAWGASTELRPITGGMLLQDVDRLDAVVTGEEGAPVGGDDPRHWRLVAGEPVDPPGLADLAFAWRAVRSVRSNAILLARDGAAVGIGMGQVNRVDSCHLAVTRAGAQRSSGAVAASDAFFPFADGLEVLIDAGVRAVVAPGGSMRDPEVIEAAQRAGISLYFTGTRHFAH